MIRIPLTPIPNQSLSIRLDGRQFALTVATGTASTLITVERDGELLVQAQRALPNAPLIPYRYLENGGGNFFFLTEGGEPPRYERFGTADSLVYASAADLEARP